MSNTRVIELRQKRAKQIADARALLEAAGERALTQEEQNNWDAMMNQADALKAKIDREERQLAQEADLGARPPMLRCPIRVGVGAASALSSVAERCVARTRWIRPGGIIPNGGAC